MAFLGLRLPKRNRISDLLGRAGRSAVDVVSANTQADVQRRLAAGQPASYQAQQAQVAAQRAAQRPTLNASQFGAPLAQRPQQPRMPSVPGADNRSLLSKVYDQVNPLDANRTFKQATPTTDKNLIQQAGQVGGQFARGTGGFLATMANTGSAQLDQVNATRDMLAAQALQKIPGLRNKGLTDWANANARALLADERFTRGKGGLLGKGTIFNKDEVKRGDLKTGLRVVPTTAGAMTEAASLMLGGFSGAKFAEDLGKIGITKAVSTQAPNLLKAGAVNVAQGGITAFSQGASGKDIAKAGLISGLTGTIGDVGLGVIGSSAFKGAKALTAAKTTGALRQQLTAKPLGEGGYIELPGGRREVVVRDPRTSPELAGEVQAGRISDDIKLINPKDIKRGGGVQGARPQKKVVDEYMGKIARDESIDPLIVSVSKRTGKISLEDGQNRLKAMNKYGITEVPVVVQRDVLPKVTTRQLSGAAQQAQLAKRANLAREAAHTGQIKNVFGEWVDDPTASGQGGYLSLGGNKKRTPEEYRMEIKSRLQEEYNQFSLNKDQWRKDTNNPSAKAQFTENGRMFKEFLKNPDAFIDKYDLMPPDMQKPKVSLKTKPAPQVGKTDPLASLKQAYNKMDDETLVSTVNDLERYGSTDNPTYQALKEVYTERKLGGVQDELRKQDIAKQTKQVEATKAKKDLDGFTDGKSSIQAGKIQKTLDGQIRYKGKVVAKRDYIKNLINDGATIKDGKLTNPDGTTPIISKTEQDYAKHLIGSAPQVGKPSVTLKTRGFTKSVKESPEVSPELQKLATGKYAKITKKETLATTEKIMQGDPAKVQADVFNRISSKTEPDAQLISDSIGLMKRLDAEGNHEIANTLQEQLSAKLTKSGQTVWAASLLNNRTPEGVLYGARKALNTAGIDITPEIETGLQAAVSKIKVTKGADKEMAIKELQKFVAQQIPSSFGEKAVTLWKAGLLTGLKTQTGNALSNVSSIALKKSSDPIAAGIDALLALKTKQRTKTFTGRGLISGTGEGLQKAKAFMKTGIDERTALTNKFDFQLTNYGKSLPGRAAQVYTDFVFKLMGAADRPYYYATLRNNLYDIAIAQSKNQGLKGAAKKQFVEDFVNKPPQNVLQTAVDAANKSIFASDTLLSNIATGAKNRTGKARPVVDAIVPFTRVPSAIVTRVFDYTPVGAAKTLAKQIASGKLDQRALSEGLAESITGTGVIWAGYQLSQAGLMTGAYPTDKQEQELWKLEGKQPYSIKFGDKWYSLNYTSPIGQIMAVGNNMSDAKKQGEGLGGQLGTGLVGAANAVVNQSFLQGLQGGLDALADPERNLNKYLKQQAGSIIPTLVNDISKATDKYQRQVNTPLEAVQARVPGLAQQLPAKTNVFGQPMEQKAGPLDLLVNPLRPTTIPTQTDLNSELRRLQDAGQGTLPDISKTNFFGEGTEVDKQTIQKIKTELGPQIQTAWEKAIADPKYQSMSDEDKRRSIDKIKSDLTAVYKAQNAEKYKQKQPDTPLSRDQLLIAKGYEATVKLPGDTVETPKQKYEAAMEVYKQDQRLGRISKVDEVNKQKELSKLRIGSTYSQDVVDLHGLSGTQVQALLESNPDLGGAFNEMIIYDQALADAGIINKPKFKDKNGNIYLPGTQETGAGGGRGGGINAAQFIKTTKARAPARVKLRGAAAPIARVQPAIRLTRPKVTIKKSKV